MKSLIRNRRFEPDRLFTITYFVYMITNTSMSFIAKKVISLKGIDAFKRQLNTPRAPTSFKLFRPIHKMFISYPVSTLFAFAFCIAFAIVGIFLISTIDKTDQEKKASGETFGAIIGVVGLVTAIAGIFSVPYLTESAMKRTLLNVSDAFKQYHNAATNNYTPVNPVM